MRGMLFELGAPQVHIYLLLRYRHMRLITTIATVTIKG